MSEFRQFLRKAPPKGYQKPGHKYTRRWWDDKANRWRYEYGRELTPGRIKRVTRSLKYAYRITLQAPDGKNEFQMVTNHSYPDLADPTGRMVPAQGAYVSRFVNRHTGKVIKDSCDDMHTASVPLSSLADDGWKVVAWEQLPIRFVSEEEAAPPQGGLTGAIRKVVPAIINRPTEYAYVFDHRGAVVWKRAGGESRVVIPNEALPKLKNNVFIHNHPSGKSFSLADVALAVKYELASMQAVGRDMDGTPKLYVLDRPKQGWLWEGATWEDVERAFHIHYTALRVAWQDMLDQGKMRYEDAETNLRHEVWAEIARQFGWHYEARELEIEGQAAMVPPGNPYRWLKHHRAFEAGQHVAEGMDWWDFSEEGA